MIVLDTHALIWWVNGDNRLSTLAGEAIKRETDREEGEILISSISAWEVALLVEKGRLMLTMEVNNWLKVVKEIDNVNFAPLDNDIAVQSVKLPGRFHADPADRIITALARHHSAPVVTCDTKIREYEYVKSIW